MYFRIIKLFLWIIIFVGVAGISLIAYSAYQSRAAEIEDSASIPNSDIPFSLQQQARTSAASENAVTQPAKPKVAAKPKPALPGPITLSIPSIGVKAHIERTGLTAKGTLATPSGFKNVAWYGAGPEPGNPGNAIISGHVNNGLTVDGAFKDLDKLSRGDEISVTRSTGEVFRFRVTSIKEYSVDDSTEDLFDSSGKSKLVLITCEGKWLPDKKTYSGRLVVFAERIK